MHKRLRIRVEKLISVYKVKVGWILPGSFVRSFVQAAPDPKHKIRIDTAASLFDGHDAAIKIMRQRR
ncbi:MAG: hypothetical protein IPP83_09510 [Flavobacteriales bacterium]|nr:hypothetical protein [Flavobacteriales bacterium]